MPVQQQGNSLSRLAPSAALSAHAASRHLVAAAIAAATGRQGLNFTRRRRRESANQPLRITRVCGGRVVCSSAITRQLQNGGKRNLNWFVPACQSSRRQRTLLLHPALCTRLNERHPLHFLTTVLLCVRCNVRIQASNIRAIRTKRERPTVALGRATPDSSYKECKKGRVARMAELLSAATAK